VLKGSELLGKHLAMWTEKLQHTGKDGVPIQIDTLSNDDLDACIATLLSRHGGRSMTTTTEDKRETFSRLYVEHGDASKAYREAFPASQKWKENTLYSSASKLLKDPKVSTRISELKQKRSQKLDISENRVLAEIAAIAFSDVGELSDDKGGFKGLKNLSPAMRRAVKSVNTSGTSKEKQASG
jgi:translation elongation factor EF-G